jgi:hypothetical protein
MQSQQDLLDAIEKLERRVSQLESALNVKADLKVWPVAMPFLELLLKRKSVTASSAYLAMYGNRPQCDQPKRKAVQPIATHLRQRLAYHGIRFEHETDDGYVLSDTAKKMVHEVLEDQKKMA